MATTEATTHTTTRAAPAAPAYTGGGILITADGFRALRARLEQLRAARSEEYSARLREARQYGEAGVNDEYLAILEDEAVIDSQIVRLEEVLSRARVVDERTAQAGSIVIGSTVSVEDQPSGLVHRYRVVGSLESAERGTVTAGSVVGEALMGKVVGDVVSVEPPRGPARTMRILAVEPPSVTSGG